MATVLFSPCSTGIFKETEKNGKVKKELIWEQCHITNTSTGEVISKDITPRFSNWTYDDFQKDSYVRFLEPMSALEVENFEEQPTQIAELKMDGHRAIFQMGAECNRIFSKRISKKTGWFNENTDQLPHLRDIAIPEFAGTVLDGEIKWGKDSRECQSIMGSLPENAIHKQHEEKKWAVLYCFDILYYRGVNVQRMPLIRRKELLSKLMKAFSNMYDIDFIKPLPIFCLPESFELLKDKNVGKIVKVKSFIELFNTVVADGEEGLIVKNLYGIYEQGKHSRAYTKLKAGSTWDCVFMGTTEPEKEYSGKLIEEGRLNEWRYWEYDGEITIVPENTSKEKMDAWFDVANPDLLIPVTKPYAMGWCGGIIFGVWKPNKKGKSLVEVGVAKGLTEEMMEDIKENVETYAKERRVVEIRAQEIIDKSTGSLRHPRFYGWRDDLDHNMCTWTKHVREEE